MEPASTIVKKLGGPTEVARIVGVHRTRVSNWTRSKEAGGSGGRIPQDHHRAILSAAEARGVRIVAEDLLPQRKDIPAPNPASHPLAAGAGR